MTSGTQYRKAGNSSYASLWVSRWILLPGTQRQLSATDARCCALPASAEASKPAHGVPTLHTPVGIPQVALCLLPYSWLSPERLTSFRTRHLSQDHIVILILQKRGGVEEVSSPPSLSVWLFWAPVLVLCSSHGSTEWERRQRLQLVLSWSLQTCVELDRDTLNHFLQYVYFLSRGETKVILNAKPGF